MKRTFILFLIIGLSISVFSQKRAVVSKELRDKAYKTNTAVQNDAVYVKEVNPTVKSVALTPIEETIGETRYDDQANASIQNRIYLYEDGTVGATWTRAMDDAAWSDRGTGYNYFDGNDWGPYPTEIVEDERVGWPSYSPLGENGEIIVAHGSNNLVISTRDQKGTGDWNYSLLAGPPDHEYMIWNRTITSGINNMRVHTLALTASTAYPPGTPYLGLNGALLYSMSTDGGVTWDLENVILDGMSSDEYVGFDGDTYTFAPPKDDIIAFLVGESWYDLFLMKSTDGGETFDKTLIWEHPYPLFDPEAPIMTDTFYCADGSQSCIVDANDMVHVCFGINRAHSDGTSSYWFPFVDGIAYWNEDMPEFSDDLNALCPYEDCSYTELVEDYNLVAWSQDINGNGVLDITDEIGTYYVGLSSYPQLVYGQNGQIYLIYSSVTETYDNGSLNYRHLWARTSPDSGITWGDFFDLSSDLVHIFDECVYPSCAANSDDYIHLIYQTDTEPGVNIWGTEHPPTNNNAVYMQVLKDDITGINEQEEVISYTDVSQNYPNPFTDETKVSVNLRTASTLTLEVINLVGQKMYETTIEDATAGMNTITIDGSRLSSGIYFYTVKAGESQVTMKMMKN